MTANLESVLEQLNAEGKEWRCSAVKVIDQIPSGYLASYGRIAETVNNCFGTEITARNIAWLRRHLYDLTNRNTTLPLHRIACQGDIYCSRDSNRTRQEAVPLRHSEGTLDHPKWWDGSVA